MIFFFSEYDYNNRYGAIEIELDNSGEIKERICYTTATLTIP